MVNHKIWLVLLTGICLLGLTQSNSFAQSKSVSLVKVKKAFVSFEYQQVIHLADSLLEHSEGLDTLQTIELLRMKAISHYSLNQEQLATLSFVRILQLNEHYQLDPMINSPKIIAFFEKIKKDFVKSSLKRPKFQTSVRSVSPRFSISAFRQSLWRSLLVPGWGHLNQGRRKKGLVLMGLSGLTMGGGIYYIFKTQALEKDYLNSIEQSEIDRRYEKFNQAFKIRNALVLGYALIWGYAQIDLLTWNEQNLTVVLRPFRFDNHPTILGFRFQF